MFGIGPKTAKDLVVNHIYSIKDLRHAVKGLNFVSPNYYLMRPLFAAKAPSVAHLSDDTLYCLKEPVFEDLQERIPRKEV